MRVLVAEDDPLIALGLCERLRALGHEPLGPVSDGEQAIALARAGRPDLYLADVAGRIVEQQSLLAPKRTRAPAA